MSMNFFLKNIVAQKGKHVDGSIRVTGTTYLSFIDRVLNKTRQNELKITQRFYL